MPYFLNSIDIRSSEYISFYFKTLLTLLCIYCECASFWKVVSDRKNEENNTPVNISIRNREPPRATRFFTIEKYFFKIPYLYLISVLTFILD